MREPLLLSTIQDAVIEFLRGRDDAVLFGAQAVNAYVDAIRATEDVDILSPRAEELVAELREFLAKRFHIAVRVREIGQGRGYRLYQIRKPKNRHLADVRPIAELPPVKRVRDVLVVSPPELIAGKIAAYQMRKGKPKSGTDWRDLAVLLLEFPELKRYPGPVGERLQARGADAKTLAAWKDLVSQKILPENEDDEF